MELNLETLKLSHGSHTPEEAAEGQLCLMEATALFAKEPLSDHPKCASRVITTFGIKLNDRWPDKRRQKLKQFIPRIVGTAAPLEIERKRAWMCADWALRELLPMLVDAAGMAEEATKLRGFPAVVDDASATEPKALARKLRPVLREKWNQAAYAAAAYAAAYAAADAAAAYAAAYAAADADAAAADAYAAADAAYDAAYAAAYAAADAAAADDADARRVKLISLVERCDAMALELLQRLIDVTASNPAGE